MEELATLFELQLLQGHILGHGRKEGVDEGVRVSLATFALVATVVEACSHKHLPNGRVSPIVGLSLRPDVNVEVIVVTLKVCRHGVLVVPVEAHHVCLQLLEGRFEGSLVLFSLTLSIADLAATIADENQHTSVVNAIETGDVGHTVGVEEDKCPAAGIIVLSTLMLEETLWSRTTILVLCSSRNLPKSLILHLRVILPLAFSLKIKEVFLLLASTELFKHDHLVFAILG